MEKLWSVREQLCKTFEQAQTSSEEGNSQMLGGPAMGLFSERPGGRRGAAAAGGRGRESSS